MLMLLSLIMSSNLSCKDNPSDTDSETDGSEYAALAKVCLIVCLKVKKASRKLILQRYGQWSISYSTDLSILILSLPIHGIKWSPASIDRAFPSSRNSLQW